MKQKRNYTVASLLIAGSQVSAGAAKHGADLGLVVASKPLVDAERNALVTSGTAYEAARKMNRTLRDELEERRKEAYDLAFVVRDSLKRKFGRTYSANWEGTGFRHSLKIPESSAALQKLLRDFADLLEKNPTFEIPDMVTAALVSAALDALIQAETTVIVHVAAMKGALAKRRRAERILRLRLRGVAEELNRVIGPIDTRWEAFGLNQPGVKQVPPAPENLTLGSETSSRELSWDRAPRANHYRVWLKVDGVHTEPVSIGSPADPDFTLRDVETGVSAEVSVTAVNSGGESLKSVPLKIRFAK